MANAAVKVAKEVKVGRLRRFGNYLKTIANDYKMVAQETAEDISSGSVKASVYLTSLVAAGILFKSNPSERDLDNALLESSHELSLVGKLVRNKEADQYVDDLRSAKRDGRLHHTSLGLFSLVWISDFRDDLDLYDARCKHTKLPWYQWHQQVTDIGILGKFVKLTQKMKDYDVNLDEWEEQN